MLGMGGPLTTMVLSALLEHEHVELVCFIKPIMASKPMPIAKRIIKTLPTSVEKLIRKYRIEHKSAEFWQLPDLICYHDIENREFKNINSLESEQYLKNKNLDFIFIANYNQILKRNILSIPLKGCYNIHPSLLPNYRGANPIFWTFKNNESKGGVTLHEVDEGIDTGRIVRQSEFVIADNETVSSYLTKCAYYASLSVTDFFTSTVDNISESTKPRSSEVKYYQKPTVKDGELIIRNNLRETYRSYQAMKHSVAVFFRLNNRIFNIKKAMLIEKAMTEKYVENKVVISKNNLTIVFKGKWHE